MLQWDGILTTRISILIALAILALDLLFVVGILDMILCYWLLWGIDCSGVLVALGIGCSSCYLFGTALGCFWDSERIHYLGCGRKQRDAAADLGI